MNAPSKIAKIEGMPALVVLSGGWRPEYMDVIRSEGLEALSIRVPGDDLTFLREMPDLRGLVLNAWDVRDLSVLEELERLETLTLNTPRQPRLRLDFAAFPGLRSLSLYWNAGFESLFASRQLDRLFVFGPPDPNLERFGSLASLSRLELSEGRRLKETRGIEHLGALTFLGLYLQSGLEALTDLGQARGLQELAIDGCKKLAAIDEVAGLASLTYLKLANCGEIASLQPIAELRHLERFFAWESTNVTDGDLSVLMRLPRLREVAMMSRRHYRPSVREVELAITTRVDDDGKS